MTTRHRAFGLDIEAGVPACRAARAFRARRRRTSRRGWPAPTRSTPRGAARPILRACVRLSSTPSPIAPSTASAGDLLIELGRRPLPPLAPTHASLLCAPGGRRPRRVAAPAPRHRARDGRACARGSSSSTPGAVATDHGLVAVIAGTGGGKSTLVAELARRGGELFCDDLLAIRRAADGLVCEPGPPLMNLDVGAPGDPATSAASSRGSATRPGSPPIATASRRAPRRVRPARSHARRPRTPSSCRSTCRTSSCSRRRSTRAARPNAASCVSASCRTSPRRRPA